MSLDAQQKQLRDRLFTAMVEATLPLKPGDDPELTLELLIEAAQMLVQHSERELEELRLELAE